MINHVRTLLLNRGREGHGLDEYGEEYIPTSFVPRKLNQALSLAHSALFGGSPDRLFLNYRMRQLMQLMHASPMESDILHKDSRVTYLPFKDDLFEAAFRVELNQLAGPSTIVHVSGMHDANMSAGIVEQLWDVEVTGLNEVTVNKRRKPLQTATYAWFDDNPIPLAGSNLSIHLHTATVGYRAQVRSRARPAMDISEVLAGLSTAFGERGLQEVFPPLAPEPVATWYRIWNESHLSAMRFTALLLAMAERIDQMPQEVS